jgi:glycine dehydrogenase subunit 1
MCFVNELTLLLPRDAREVVRELAEYGVLGGVSLGRLYPQADGLHHALLVTATETTTDDDIHALATILEAILVDTHEGAPT